MLLIGSVKLEQIFRGTPNSPVSLLNKASICTTGLTPKVSENLSVTTFTINKDNSLTLTPVPKSPATNHDYYDEPKFHKVEFTPRSTPGLDRMSSTYRSESVIEENKNEIELPKENKLEEMKIALQINEDDKPKFNNFEVYVPKAHKTYEEYLPNINIYTEPNHTESRCSLKSPSSFIGNQPETKSKTEIQEKSLPVKTLIDTFEHNNRPVMRYLQLEESIPLSENIKHLHDDPQPSSNDKNQILQYEMPNTYQESKSYYTADTTIETRSFVYDTKEQQDVVDDNKSEYVDGSDYADKSGITDRSEYGDRSEYTDDILLPFDLRSDMKFQTIRQLATPDSLESSMLFAQKQSSCDERQREYHNNNNNNNYTAISKVPGKMNIMTICFCTFVKFSQ